MMYDLVVFLTDAGMRADQAESESETGSADRGEWRAACVHVHVLVQKQACTVLVGLSRHRAQTAHLFGFFQS